MLATDGQGGRGSYHLQSPDAADPHFELSLDALDAPEDSDFEAAEA